MPVTISPWVKAKRTRAPERMKVWERLAEGRSQNSISEEVGVSKGTVGKLWAELHEPPGPPLGYLDKHEASVLLKSYWEDRWGTPTPARNSNPLKAVLRRSHYPAPVAALIHEVLTGPRRTPEAYGHNKNRFLEIRMSLRKPGAVGDRWVGGLMERYVHTIMVAEVLDEAQLIKALRDHPDPDDHMFRAWLQVEAGMGPEARDAWVAQRDENESVSN